MGTVLVHASPWIEKSSSENSMQLPIHGDAEAGDMAICGWSWNSATAFGQPSGHVLLDEVGSTGDTMAPSCMLTRRTLSGGDISNGYVTMGVHTAAGSGGCIVAKDFLTTFDFDLVPLDKTASTGSFAFGTQVLTRGGILGVYIVGQNTVQAGNFTPPGSWTEIGDRVDGRNACMGYRIFTAGGSSGSITPVSSQTTRGVGVLAGFRPVPAPVNAKFMQFLA